MGVVFFVGTGLGMFACIIIVWGAERLYIVALPARPSNLCLDYGREVDANIPWVH